MIFSDSSGAAIRKDWIVHCSTAGFIARIKYKEGVGSNLEVVEADAALIQAEINYLGAIYDGLISKINLEKALGLLKPNLTN